MMKSVHNLLSVALFQTSPLLLLMFEIGSSTSFQITERLEERGRRNRSDMCGKKLFTSPFQSVCKKTNITSLKKKLP